MPRRTLKEIRSSVANATVTFVRTGGQGVLVRDSFIVTAAHCLEYDAKDGMAIALGAHLLVKVAAANGKTFPVTPLVIEPCADVAVLGPLDGGSFPETLWSDYYGFRDRTRQVALFAGRFDTLPAEFRIHIRTHRKSWTAGTAMVLRRSNPTLLIESDEGIEEGASGGAIINDAGELVGVVSTFGGEIGGARTKGSCPFLPWALPEWICRHLGA